MGKNRPARHVKRTLLIVCEGDAEELLLRHLRQSYLRDQPGVGIALTIKNHHGKGGDGVLQTTIRIARRESQTWDQVAVMIDTDKDWSDVQRKQARAKRIHAIESSPCLEAWLLDVAGKQPPMITAECKRLFLREFGAEAHDESIHTRHFDRGVLDAARARVSVLDDLLTLLGVPG
ncbi:MAG: hypothetical protein RL260_3637 [Pseudomonadota bacterium]|jgi:hypothetical protein